MDRLGDVLELLHSARDRFSSCRLTLQEWRDEERLHEAWRKRAEQRPSHAVFSSGRRVYRLQGKGTHPPLRPTSEEVSRLWIRKPSQLRRETDLPVGQGTRVLVLDGSRSRSYDPPSQTFVTNEGMGILQLDVLFDPAPIIPACSFDVGDRTIAAGREAIRVAAWHREPRDRWPTPLGPHGDRHDLLVDAERGALLAITTFLDGNVLTRREVLDIAFDEPFPDDTFVLEPPPGATVRRIQRGRPRRGVGGWWRRISHQFNFRRR